MKKVRRNINFNYKMFANPKERIELLEKAGFDGIFLYTQYTPSDYIELIMDSNLEIEALHLPYKEIVNGTVVDSKYVNALWNDDDRSKSYIEWLIKEIEFAAKYNIKKVVAHLTGGKVKPNLNKTGINNIKRVLERCEDKGIKLCVENTRINESLIYVFENINSTMLKFCFDSGHANAMTKDINSFPWQYFGPKLDCLHLNDNNGLEDQHLIPFEGNIEWDSIIKVIYGYNPFLDLTLEVRANDTHRSNLSESEYLNRCSESLDRLNSII